MLVQNVTTSFATQHNPPNADNSTTQSWPTCRTSSSNSCGCSEHVSMPLARPLLSPLDLPNSKKKGWWLAPNSVRHHAKAGKRTRHVTLLDPSFVNNGDQILVDSSFMKHCLEARFLWIRAPWSTVLRSDSCGHSCAASWSHFSVIIKEKIWFSHTSVSHECIERQGLGFASTWQCQWQLSAVLFFFSARSVVVPCLCRFRRRDWISLWCSSLLELTCACSPKILWS